MQVVRVFPVHDHANIHVLCSNGFVLEQAISQSCGARIVSNDIQLLTSAIGMAAVGSSLDFRFHGELGFVEDYLRGCSFLRRVAAVVVLADISRMRRRTRRDGVTWDYCVGMFGKFLDDAEVRLERFLSTVRVDEFRMCDFRDHAHDAIAHGAALIGFPPKNSGYVKATVSIFDGNVDWYCPERLPWSQREAVGFVRDICCSGIPYCLGVDVLIDGLKPVARCIGTGRHSYYLYTRDSKSSFVRIRSHGSKAFAYVPVVASELCEGTEVSLVHCSAREMYYLKNRLILNEFQSYEGRVNLLVYLGGRLAGAMAYREKEGGGCHGIRLVSDFAVSRERRLSKLIAMLATCEQAVSFAARRMGVVGDVVVSFVHTNRAVAMKYRSVFKLERRFLGKLKYVSGIRSQSPQEIYREWFRKHASRNANSAIQAS